ncbi:MAG: ABC transporter substrate-binding protein [Rhodospirillaceae bacterium]|nr:ABC transporter substrate-binding protein [Rhodospirillaceae bacterium]
MAALALVLTLAVAGLGTAVAEGPAAPPAAGSSATLPRVASVGLCADHYVLALADPGQIASLSREAVGPLSPQRDRAAAYPLNRGSAEDLLMSGAEVVVMRSWGAAATAAMAERFGMRVVRLGDGDRLADLPANLRLVGDAIGRADAGEAMAQAAERLIAAVPPQRPGDPVAAYLGPAGGTAGPGTFVDDVLVAAGLGNLTGELGRPGWGHIDLETMVLTPPDLFVLSFFDTTRPSLTVALARHSVFRDLAVDMPVLTVPGAYWPCTSPHLVDAVAHLAGELDEAGFPAATP